MWSIWAGHMNNEVLEALKRIRRERFVFNKYPFEHVPESVVTLLDTTTKTTSPALEREKAIRSVPICDVPPLPKKSKNPERKYFLECEYTINGKSNTLHRWLLHYKLDYFFYRDRLRMGMTPTQALTLPFREDRRLAQPVVEKVKVETIEPAPKKVKKSIAKEPLAIVFDKVRQPVLTKAEEPAAPKARKAVHRRVKKPILGEADAKEIPTTQNCAYIMDGVCKPLTEWLNEYDVPIGSYRGRIQKGMTPEQAIKTPVKRRAVIYAVNPRKTG